MVTFEDELCLSPLINVRCNSKYGTGLYSNLPLPALALETLWGVLCWWIYRGSWKLLGLIVVMGIAAIPLHSVAVNIGEAALGGQSTVFALVILVQMLTTSGLVWLFARKHAEPTRSIRISSSGSTEGRPV